MEGCREQQSFGARHSIQLRTIRFDFVFQMVRFVVKLECIRLVDGNVFHTRCDTHDNRTVVGRVVFCLRSTVCAITNEDNIHIRFKQITQLFGDIHPGTEHAEGV